VPETLAGPISKVFDRLVCGRGVEQASQVVPAYDADYFDVDD
jgi:hypothetical protein